MLVWLQAREKPEPSYLEGGGGARGVKTAQVMSIHLEIVLCPGESDHNALVPTCTVLYLASEQCVYVVLDGRLGTQEEYHP